MDVGNSGGQLLVQSVVCGATGAGHALLGPMTFILDINWYQPFSIQPSHRSMDVQPESFLNNRQQTLGYSVHRIRAIQLGSQDEGHLFSLSLRAIAYVAIIVVVALW